MATAFPLQWPMGVPRTERHATSLFKTEISAALKNVQNSLRRFGDGTGKAVSNIVISSNYTLGVQSPSDPGVAVWFLWDGAERCIAVDRYPKLAHNLQAIHMVLEARVTEARHGGLHIVRQTFSGFVALPSPEMFGGKTCWQILDIPPRSNEEKIRAAHRALALKLHPDGNEGDANKMSDVNAARDMALAEIGAKIERAAEASL